MPVLVAFAGTAPAGAADRLEVTASWKHNIASLSEVPIDTSHQFCLAFTEATGAAFSHFTAKPFGRDACKHAVGRDDVNGLTSYESLISWDALGLSGGPAPGRALRINAIVNEDDGNGLDRKKWRHDPPDWGGWSWEPENAFVREGKLYLRMQYGKHPRQSGAQRHDTLYYTSGIVRTRKRIRYGYFEARIKAAPRFPGVCPAFWADYAGDKDRRTEIDFVELTMRGNRGPAVTDFNTHVAYHPKLPADKAPLREHVQVKLPFAPGTTSTSTAACGRRRRSSGTWTARRSGGGRTSIGTSRCW